MKFPTLEEVEAADRVQLCRWHRFLPSAGTEDMSQRSWETGRVWNPTPPDVIEQQQKIQQRIHERFVASGGFTPEISKYIGWGN